MLDTTLEEESGFETLLWCDDSLEFSLTLVTGVKGEPDVPNTGKYPVLVLEWRAGEEWSRELAGGKEREDLSSALLLNS